MTKQTWPGSPHVSGWSRLATRQKFGVIVSGILVACLGVLTLIGALAGADQNGARKTPTTVPSRST